MKTNLGKYPILTLLVGFGLAAAATTAKGQINGPKPYTGQGPYCYVRGQFTAIQVNAPNPDCDQTLRPGQVTYDYAAEALPDYHVVASVSINGGKSKKIDVTDNDACFKVGQEAAFDAKANTFVIQCATKQHHARPIVEASKTCALSADGKKYLCSVSGARPEDAKPATPVR